MYGTMYCYYLVTYLVCMILSVELFAPMTLFLEGAKIFEKFKTIFSIIFLKKFRFYIRELQKTPYIK